MSKYLLAQYLMNKHNTNKNKNKNKTNDSTKPENTQKQKQNSLLNDDIFFLLSTL
jgi:Na+/glutamate symporter